jgi:hypothetical protein
MPRISHHTLLLPFHPATFEFPADPRFPNPDTGLAIPVRPGLLPLGTATPALLHSSLTTIPTICTTTYYSFSKSYPTPKTESAYLFYISPPPPIPTTLSRSPFSGSQVPYISISTPTHAEQYPTSIHFDFIYLFLCFYTYGITPVIAQCQR